MSVLAVLLDCIWELGPTALVTQVAGTVSVALSLLATTAAAAAATAAATAGSSEEDAAE